MLAMTLSRLATAARLGHARSPGTALGPRPVGRLVLYDFEGCPWCRRVREAITDLALTVRVLPCPKGGERFRPEAIVRSGKKQFPFLVDEGAGVELLESDAIVHHLYDRYGTGDAPGWLLGGGFALTSNVASLVRGSAGTWPRPSRPPEHDLKLTGHESGSAARLVRERLCELELAYVREAGPLAFEDEGIMLHDAAAILEHLGRYTA